MVDKHLILSFYGNLMKFQGETCLIFAAFVFSFHAWDIDGGAACNSPLTSKVSNWTFNLKSITVSFICVDKMNILLSFARNNTMWLEIEDIYNGS